MDASHPGTMCGSVLDASRPLSALPRAQRGPKEGPKVKNFAFWPFWAPKRPRGWLLSKCQEESCGGQVEEEEEDCEGGEDLLSVC